MSYLNLSRRFVERQTYDDVELHTAKVWGKLVGWEKVLSNRCCVVVAPANFGKTTEMGGLRLDDRNALRTGRTTHGADRPRSLQSRQPVV